MTINIIDIFFVNRIKRIEYWKVYNINWAQCLEMEWFLNTVYHLPTYLCTSGPSNGTDHGLCRVYVKYFINTHKAMKNISIILIAVIAAVVISSALAVTMTTGQAFAELGSTRGRGGINGGNNAHDPCGNAGPATHNPNCQ
jgi:hypothetical protein